MLIPPPIFDLAMVSVETITGLYPALNKIVDVSKESKILVRIIVFLGLALLTAERKDILSVTEFTANNFFRYLFLGTLSFTIMFLTQNGLKELPVETNLMVQQSFPIISTIIAYNILKRDQPLEYVPLFVCAYMLMLFVLRPKPHHIKKIEKFSQEKKNSKWKAFIGILIAAVLSCILFLIFRLKIESYETGIIRTNLGALIILIGYFIYSNQMPNMSNMDWVKLIGMNLAIGYTLSKMRLKLRRSVPEVHSAIFIFLGTTIAFLLGESEPFFKRKTCPDFEQETALPVKK
jgi:hypothetical protein